MVAKAHDVMVVPISGNNDKIEELVQTQVHIMAWGKQRLITAIPINVNGTTDAVMLFFEHTENEAMRPAAVS